MPGLVPAGILAAFWCGLVSAQAAPPRNDDFLAAYKVTGLPVSAEGGNQEATRQLGEPNDADGHGRASLWWRWTAPSSAWIEVNTLESDYDTMLAVYSGGALNRLTLLKYNDDALKTKRSRVRFSAVAGIEYHIQVQSWFQTPGIARLRIQAASAPQPPTLLQLTLTPNPVIAQNPFDYPEVRSEAEIIAPDGLAKAVLFLHGPQGTFKVVENLALLESGPVSEKPFTGIYGARSLIPHGNGWDGKSTFVGDWQIRLVLTDDFGDSFGYGGSGEPPIPEGSLPVLKVSGSDDVQGAVVSSLKMDANVIDVTDSYRSLALEVTAEDDVQVDLILIYLVNSQGYMVAETQSFGPPDSGTRQKGVWKLGIWIPQQLPAGSYRLECFSYDSVGRGAKTTVPEAERTLTVINKGVSDNMAPEIKAVSVSPSRISMDDLPVNVMVRIEVSDGGEIESVNAGFTSNWHQYPRDLRKVSRTGSTEIWEGTIEIGQEALPGLYPMQYSAMDRTQNRMMMTNGKRWGWEPTIPVSSGIPAVFTITPGTNDAFSVWRAKYAQLEGPQGEFDVDADADGFINAVEFLCGTDPLLASGPGKPDPNGERAPLFFSTPTALRLEYRLSAENISLGEGTYWQLKPRILRPSSRVATWYTSYSEYVTKDLFRAELPIDGPNGFMKLVFDTESYKTIFYLP
ncbi:MAG: hypothetical protein EOP86_16610 [Verrucomicrobiaceae bacterium]|nr:MAG: hypothetical protein EOP86_16610 [Verrucomicrobiaceae bacterium]